MNYLSALLREKQRRDAARLAFDAPFSPKQKAAVIIYRKYGEVWIFGGNRTGKTECSARLAIQSLLTNREKWWFMSPSYKLQKEGLQEKVEKFIPGHFWKKPFYVGSGVLSELQLTNGSVIFFHTYEQGRENLQSAGIDGVLFDEECPWEIYKEVSLRQIAGRKLKKIHSLTPLIAQKYVEEALKLPTAIIMEWKDNIFLTKEQIEQMRAGLSERELITREKGLIAAAVGRALPFQFEIVEKPQLLEVDFIDGLDPGFTDPTGYVFLAVTANLEVTVISSWGESGLGYDEMSAKIKKTRGVRLPSKSISDNNEPRLNKELKKRGLHFKAVEKTAPDARGWHEHLIRKSSWFFEKDKIKFMPGNDALIDQLRLLSWKAKTEEEILPELDLNRSNGHHFDIAMALLYVLEKLSKKYKKEVSKSAPSPINAYRAVPPAQKKTRFEYKKL